MKIFKSYACGLVLSAALFGGRAHADPLTALTVVTTAEEVSAKVKSVGNSFEGNAKGVVGFATTQLDLEVTRVRGLLKDHLQTPLENLSIDMRNTVDSLQATTERLNELVTMQRGCGLQDAQVFLAGLKTVTQELKRGTIVFDPGMPRLTHFTFAGHMPLAVPPEGGSVTVSGWQLWKSGEPAPQVELLSEDFQTVLGRLEPSRGSSEDDIAVHVPADMLKEHQGACLNLRVSPRQGRPFWKFWAPKQKTIAELTMTMCVPETTNLHFELTAEADYTCKEQKTDWASYQDAYEEHHSCEEDDHAFTKTLYWDLPKGCTIVNVQAVKDSLTRWADDGIQVSWSGNTVSVSGRVGRNCLRLPFGRSRLFSHGVWKYHIRPMVTCDVEASKTTVSAIPARFEGGIPSTQGEVLIPKVCQPARANVRYTLAYALGNEPMRVLHKSASEQVTSTASGTPVSVGGVFLTPAIDIGEGQGNPIRLALGVKPLSCRY